MSIRCLCFLQLYNGRYMCLFKNNKTLTETITELNKNMCTKHPLANPPPRGVGRAPVGPLLSIHHPPLNFFLRTTKHAECPICRQYIQDRPIEDWIWRMRCWKGLLVAAFLLLLRLFPPSSTPSYPPIDICQVSKIAFNRRHEIKPRSGGKHQSNTRDR